MENKIKYIQILLIFGLPAILISQKDTTKTELKINQVEVVKAFDVTLEESRKTDIKAVIPEQKPYNPNYKYDITIVPANLNYPDPQIKPLAMNPDAPFKEANGYFQAGYGFRKNPELMAGYHTSKKEKYDAGIHMQYEALNNHNTLPYQQYRNTIADLYGNYMIKENQKLYGNVNTSFRKRYLYQDDIGVDTLFTKEQSVRNINRYEILAGVTNAEPTKYQFNYDFRIGLDNLSMTNTDVRENGIKAGTKLEKLFKKNSVISIEADFNYTAFNGKKELSLTTATFKPMFKTKYKNLIFEGGLNALYSSDLNSALFPEIYISYGIAGPVLQVYAGISQEQYGNHYRNVTLRNPFLSNDIDSLVNTVNRKYYAGIKGQYSYITYQVTGGLKDARDMMFMTNKKSDLRYFDMVYSDANIIFVSGNIEFKASESLSLGGWINQNIFDLKTLPEAWHTPNLEGNVYGRTKLLNQKLELTADLYFGSQLPYLSKENKVSKSNALLDLNINAQYNFTEKIGLFIRGINLLNNKFERWYGYPAVGINGLAGFKVAF